MTESTSTSLYKKIGGRLAVDKVVDNFYERVIDDDLLKPFFDDTDMAKQRRHQKAFIAMALGGPKDYTGKGMLEAHEGRGIEEHHFGAVAGHLEDALEWAGVGAEDIATILSTVGSLHDEVVGH